MWISRFENSVFKINDLSAQCNLYKNIDLITKLDCDNLEYLIQAKKLFGLIEKFY